MKFSSSKCRWIIAICVCAWMGFAFFQLGRQYSDTRPTPQPIDGAIVHHASHDILQFATKYWQGSRYKTHVSTDKSTYQPGEMVMVRGVMLDAASMAAIPASTRIHERVSMTILGPKGEEVFSTTLQGPQDSAVAGQWAVPAGQPGGKYTVKIAPQRAGCAPAERSFHVQTFHKPQMRLQLKFQRDGYGPGERVTATLTALRAAGGVPKAASVHFTARVDGVEVASGAGSALSPAGRSSIAFDLPASIERGAGSLNVQVRDGGVMESVSKTLPIILQTLDIEVYPEAGDLVVDLPTSVYVQASNIAGNPADFAGEILAVAGNGGLTRVATVKTLHEGRGKSTVFTPVANKHYILQVTEPATVRQVVQLPQVQATGASLSCGACVVRPMGTVTLTFAANQPGRYSISLSRREVELAVSAVEVTAESVAVPLDVLLTLSSATTADGMLRATVTDLASGEPLAERLVFRHPHHFAVSVTPDRSSYGPGDKVTLTVQTSYPTDGSAGNKDVPFPAVVGITVTDDALLSRTEKRLQAPRLPAMALLEDEIRGDLSDAAAYLTATFADPDALEDEAEAEAEAEAGASTAVHGDVALDLLMGTQGWRRFVYKQPGQALANAPSSSSSDEDVATKEDLQRLMAIREAPEPPIMMAFARGAPMMEKAGAMPMAMQMARPAAAPMMAGAAPGNDAAGGAPAFGGMPEHAMMADFAAADGGVEEEAEEGAAMGAGEGMMVPGGDAVALDDAAVDMDAAVMAEPPMAPGGFAADQPPMPPMPPMQPGFEDGVRHQRHKRASGGRNKVRQYSHSVRPGRKPGDRSDFTDTVLWIAALPLDGSGQAKVSFYLSDSLTTFRASVDGYSSLGWLGSGTAMVQSVTPFAVDVKLPLELTNGDRVQVPVVTTVASLPEDVRVQEEGRTLSMTPVTAGPLQVESTVAAGYRLQQTQRTARTYVDALASLDNAQAADAEAAADRTGFPIRLSMTAAISNLEQARVTRTAKVLPLGFPQAVNRGGMVSTSAEGSLDLQLPSSLVPGSLSLAAAAYPSPVASITRALEALIRQPCGCFEQTSATTYPLVMAQQYFKSHSGVDEDLVLRAQKQLDDGYKRLLSFESSDGGFEWFGASPGHEALTAYGALQFQDMAKVMDVDQDMLQRTRDWLMGRRDEAGGFKRNPRSLDSFGRASDEITNAYIVWALSATSLAAELKSEVAALVKRTKDNDAMASDPYFIGLVAGASYNTGDSEAGDALAARLAELQVAAGDVPDASGTITCSGGNSRTIETTSVAVLAWLNNDDKFGDNTFRAIEWLAAQCQDGGFGSTQATVLALKAIVAYDAARAAPKSSGSLILTLDGKIISKASFTPESRGVLEFDTSKVPAMLSAGNKYSLGMKMEVDGDAEASMAYSMTAEFFTPQPASAEDAPIGLQTSLSNTQVAEGDATELRVTVTNLQEVQQPMVIVQLGLPGGLEPRIAQLDELVAAGSIAFYELHGARGLVLYWRGMDVSDEYQLNIDLVAAVPGRYTGAASSASLYYTPEAKSWAAGVEVDIAAAATSGAIVIE